MAPAIIPERLEPFPKNDVALTTPTTFSFSLGEVLLIPTFLSLSTLRTLVLPNFDKFLARDISQLLSSYLGHKKNHQVIQTDGQVIQVTGQML